jgi:hypothetical protein
MLFNLPMEGIISEMRPRPWLAYAADKLTVASCPGVTGAAKLLSCRTKSWLSCAMFESLTIDGSTEPYSSSSTVPGRAPLPLPQILVRRPKNPRESDMLVEEWHAIRPCRKLSHTMEEFVELVKKILALTADRLASLV